MKTVIEFYVALVLFFVALHAVETQLIEAVAHFACAYSGSPDSVDGCLSR